MEGGLAVRSFIHPPRVISMWKCGVTVLSRAGWRRSRLRYSTVLAGLFCFVVCILIWGLNECMR